MRDPGKEECQVRVPHFFQPYMSRSRAEEAGGPEMPADRDKNPRSLFSAAKGTGKGRLGREETFRQQLLCSSQTPQKHHGPTKPCQTPTLLRLQKRCPNSPAWVVSEEAEKRSLDNEHPPAQRVLKEMPPKKSLGLHDFTGGFTIELYTLSSRKQKRKEQFTVYS